MKGMDFLWVGLIVLGAALLAIVVHQTVLEQPIGNAMLKSAAGGSTAKSGGA